MKADPVRLCVWCKGGEMHAGQTTITLEREGVTVVFKEVPAQVCDTCGEAQVEEPVLAQMFREADESVARGAEVEVRRFVAA